MVCLLVVQTFTVNLEPTLVTVLRNKSSRVLWCGPIDDAKHKFCRLFRKQENAVPVWVASLEHADHGISPSFLCSSAYQMINSSTLVKYTHGAWGKQQLTGAGTSVNETWADRKECITLPTELNGVLRVDEVQGSLRDSIGHSSGVSGLLDELGITGGA